MALPRPAHLGTEDSFPTTAHGIGMLGASRRNVNARVGLDQLRIGARLCGQVKRRIVALTGLRKALVRSGAPSPPLCVSAQTKGVRLGFEAKS